MSTTGLPHLYSGKVRELAARNSLFELLLHQEIEHVSAILAA